MEKQESPRRKFLEASPVTKCVHCEANTSARCPRCLKYSCIRQVCLDAHDAVCKPEKGDR